MVALFEEPERAPLRQQERALLQGLVQAQVRGLSGGERAVVSGQRMGICVICGWSFPRLQLCIGLNGPCLAVLVSGFWIRSRPSRPDSGLVRPGVP